MKMKINEVTNLCLIKHMAGASRSVWISVPRKEKVKRGNLGSITSHCSGMSKTGSRVSFNKLCIQKFQLNVHWLRARQLPHNKET